jgi:hypothetical protein
MIACSDVEQATYRRCRRRHGRDESRDGTCGQRLTVNLAGLSGDRLSRDDNRRQRQVNDTTCTCIVREATLRRAPRRTSARCARPGCARSGPLDGGHTAARSCGCAAGSASPHRTMRSPKVDRLICNSAAARDLLPWVARSAQRIRLVSNSRSLSSSEMGAGRVPTGVRAAVGAGAGPGAGVIIS